VNPNIFSSFTGQMAVEGSTIFSLFFLTVVSVGFAVLIALSLYGAIAFVQIKMKKIRDLKKPTFVISISALLVGAGIRNINVSHWNDFTGRLGLCGYLYSVLLREENSIEQIRVGEQISRSILYICRFRKGFFTRYL
jgi:hypothetical protein